MLDLNYNLIRRFPDGLFKSKRKLSKLTTLGNDIENLSSDNFTHIENCRSFRINSVATFPQGRWMFRDSNFTKAECEAEVDQSLNRQVFCQDYPIPCQFLMTCHLTSTHRSLDQAFRQSKHRKIDQACDFYTFDEIAYQITGIVAQPAYNGGNLTISENGLANLTNMKLFNAKNYAQHQAYLDIPRNEFITNAPNTSELVIWYLQLTENAIEAFVSLKNTLTRLQLKKCTPHSEILGMIGEFSKLERLRLWEFPDLGPSPAVVFRKSASTLRVITIHEVLVSRIQADTFLGMRNLEKLSWMESGITEIEPATFDDLVNLKELDLSRNQIQQLPDGLFEKTRMLTGVSLYGMGNRIVNLSRNNFTHIAGFQHLGGVGD